MTHRKPRIVRQRPSGRQAIRVHDHFAARRKPILELLGPQQLNPESSIMGEPSPSNARSRSRSRRYCRHRRSSRASFADPRSRWQPRRRGLPESFRCISCSAAEGSSKGPAANLSTARSRGNSRQRAMAQAVGNSDRHLIAACGDSPGIATFDFAGDRDADGADIGRTALRAAVRRVGGLFRNARYGDRTAVDGGVHVEKGGQPRDRSEPGAGGARGRITVSHAGIDVHAGSPDRSPPIQR